MTEVRIRRAVMDDLDAVTAVEAASFPPAEAASRERFRGRMQSYGNHFWLLEEDGRPVGLVDGMCTDRPAITDDLFEDPTLHREDGAWQSVFGLAVIPECRRRGYAARLLSHFIEQARAEGRRGVHLTCKDHLVHWYARFGFVDRGISASVHGGAVWHDMILEF